MEERSVCVLWGWRFPNQFHIMSETPYSFETVDREPEQVIPVVCCCALRRTGKFALQSKKGCVYFN